MDSFMNDASGFSFQPEIARELSTEIENNVLSHAYLFAGPPGSGKKTLAVNFAFSILAASDPNARLYYAQKEHPDFLLLQRAEGKTLFSKALISDELIPWLGFKPFQAKKRVVVLFDAQLMSLEGANALLKTLEEPPEYTVLILVSDQENLLETITSRCRRVRFTKLNDHKMTAFLNLQKEADPSLNLTEAKIKEITRLSFGDANLAKKLLQTDCDALKNTALSLLRDMAHGKRSAAFQLAKALQKEGKPLYHEVVSLIRDTVLKRRIGDRVTAFALTETGLENALAAPEIVEQQLLEIQQILPYENLNVGASIININIALAFFRCFKK